MRLLITEVHNYGGFFGGDTVTLSGRAWGAPAAEEQTLTIDEAALANVTERHQLVVGMLLELAFAGERVERAQLLGAAGYSELRMALGPAQIVGPLDRPRILLHRCTKCALWVETSDDHRCPLCGTPI